MGSRPALTAAFFACLIAAGAPAAAAADAPSPATKRAAEADAAKANKALAAHDFAGAAESWERAYRQVPNTKWILGAANARKRNGDLARAANDFARYLKAAAQNAPQRAAAKKELAAIAPKLGQLELKADGATAVSVDGETIDLPLASTTYVTAGSHLVEARFKEETVKESPTVRAGAVTTVTFTPPTAAPAPAPAPASEVVAEPTPIDKPAPRERSRPLPPLVVWVGAG
ncbi:MAG: hypothetical protein K0S65_5198, partial [Labilithrix sp.]|nr:hypothetical protein [Labilithrix sp.]